MSSNKFTFILVNPDKSLIPIIGKGSLDIDDDNKKIKLLFTPINPLGNPISDETSYKAIKVPFETFQVAVYAVDSSEYINSMSFVIEQADVDSIGNISLLNGCAYIKIGNNTYQGSLVGVSLNNE